MDLSLVPAVVDASRRRHRRNWLLLLAAAGVTGYGAYRVYNLPSVTRRRKKLVEFLKTLVSLAEVISSSSTTVSLLSSDLNRFVRSDSDEIPNTIKQISKISTSDDFLASVSRVSEAVTVGVLRGFKSESTNCDSSMLDRLLEKLFSDSGAGFVSVVAGNFAKGLVTEHYRSNGGGCGGELGSKDGDRLPQWAQLLCAEKSRKLVGECVERFVTAAVTVYLEKTMNTNAYSDLFSGLTHPNNEAKMKDLLVSLCNGAIETLVKTSHEVMTTTSNRTSNFASGKEDCKLGKQPVGISSSVNCGNTGGGGGGGGWFDKISATLALPSNRRFVLDLTGRVTFDTVRSFLEFLLIRFGEGVRRSTSIVQEEVVLKGLELVRYISAKSLLVLTVCLSFCLHLMPGTTTRFLVPA